MHWPCLVLALMGSAASARADPAVWTRAELEVTRGPGTGACMTRADVEQAVESRLRRPVFVPQAEADVRVDVRFERRQGRWWAALVLHCRNGSELGTRELDTAAEHCSSLDDSLALALALMLDVPREQLRTSAAEQLDDAAKGRREPVPSTPVRLPRDTDARREPWEWQAGAFAAAAFGLLPGLAPGARASLGVAPPRFLLTELEATLWFEQTVQGAGGGAGLRAWTLGVYLCPLRWREGPWSVAGCAGQSVGWVRAEGFGYDRTESATRLLYGVGPRIRGAVRLAGPLALRVGVGAEVPFLTDRFVYLHPDGSPGGLFRVAAVVPVAELGLGLVP